MKKFKDFLQEEAPANSMGTAGISGLPSAQDGVMGYDKLLAPGVIRRKPSKMFGGKAVFTVPSDDYHKATLGKRKGKHIPFHHTLTVVKQNCVSHFVYY